MTTSSLPSGAVLIVGAGTGLGGAVAREFAAKGVPVAVSARRPEPIEHIAASIRNEGGKGIAVPADATDTQQVESAVTRVRRELGPIGTLIYNAGNFVHGTIMDLTAGDFQEALNVGVYGAFLYSRLIVPELLEQGRGVMIFTGATSSVMAPPHGPAFAAAKFGLRGFALSLARELGPKGIHVAHAIIDGVIDTPKTRKIADWSDDELVDPQGIAASYWHLATQPPRAWSFELDVRPYTDDYLDN